MRTSIEPVLLVHGGAGQIPDEMVAAYEAGVQAALAAGWAILERDGSAIDAVEVAIASMEDSGTFDAGRGSVLNRDGRVQLDAMIMDGSSLAAGGIGAAEAIRNPIRVARAVMDRSPQVYFGGHGADRFAVEHGFEPIDNAELVTPRERRRYEEARGHAARGLTARGIGPDPDPVDGPIASAGHDTVGAVALDRHGDLAAGTSTGGIAFKPVGRIGDSSIIGSGCYADNETAAVSCTGEGESMMRLVLGKWAVDRVGAGDPPQRAADSAVGRLASRLDGHGGLILLDRLGRIGVAFNTQRMAWGSRTAGGGTASRGGEVGPRDD